jgi:ubiquinone/menaquinone biosynthesis C-methylase UbiE
MSLEKHVLLQTPDFAADGLRKQEEIVFHNQRECDRLHLGPDAFERKYSNKKWYSVVRKSRDHVSEWLEANCPGKAALDYCCGLGGMSVELASHGARVSAFDISDQSAATARHALEDAGFGHLAGVYVMDAENLGFAENTFDIIVCSGVLHHLDLERAYSELARVLRPGGKVICMEALGHNPAIALYRRLTPHLRTEWEAEHILKIGDVKLARRFFERSEPRFFHLFSIAGVFFRRTPLFRPLLTILEALDDLILKVPGVKLLAWQVIFELSGPRKD